MPLDYAPPAPQRPRWSTRQLILGVFGVAVLCFTAAYYATGMYNDPEGDACGAAGMLIMAGLLLWTFLDWTREGISHWLRRRLPPP